MHWQTSRRQISLERVLVMGILNVTPDSFSDGGEFASLDTALAHAEKMIATGADIIDIGGESTRPGSDRVSVEQEIERVVPIIGAIAKRFDTPISIDTTRSEVAKCALDAGAEIINDISGLRWDASIADVATATNAGLVLMHSRGEFETMHTQPSVDDILTEVVDDLRRAISTAHEHGVRDEQIVLDVGIGFGKTTEQNLELIAKLGNIVSEFENYPVLVGASRKSFIGKIIRDAPPSERLGGSIAAAIAAVANGARIVRVHDVVATIQALTITSAISHSNEPVD
ncbi:MAG: dihydropteroate synthase [Pyrinomonadaceae bacterium]